MLTTYDCIPIDKSSLVNANLSICISLNIIDLADHVYIKPAKNNSVYIISKNNLSYLKNSSEYTFVGYCCTPRLPYDMPEPTNRKITVSEYITADLHMLVYKRIYDERLKLIEMHANITKNEIKRFFTHNLDRKQFIIYPNNHAPIASAAINLLLEDINKFSNKYFYDVEPKSVDIMEDWNKMDMPFKIIIREKNVPE